MTRTVTVMPVTKTLVAKYRATGIFFGLKFFRKLKKGNGDNIVKNVKFVDKPIVMNVDCWKKLNKENYIEKESVSCHCTIF